MKETMKTRVLLDILLLFMQIILYSYENGVISVFFLLLNEFIQLKFLQLLSKSTLGGIFFHLNHHEQKNWYFLVFVLLNIFLGN